MIGRWAATTAMALLVAPGAPAFSDDSAAAVVGDLGPREAGRIVSSSTAGSPAIEVEAVVGRADAIDEVAEELASRCPQRGVGFRVHVDEISETVSGRQWGVRACAVVCGWSVTRGGGVTVAVLDTGVVAYHARISPDRVVAGIDLTGWKAQAGGMSDPHGRVPPLKDHRRSRQRRWRAGGGAGGEDHVGAGAGRRRRRRRASDVAEGIICAVDHGARGQSTGLGPTANCAGGGDPRSEGVTVVPAGNSGVGAPPGTSRLSGCGRGGRHYPDNAVASFSTRGSIRRRGGTGDHDPVDRARRRLRIRVRYLDVHSLRLRGGGAGSFDRPALSPRDRYPGSVDRDGDRHRRRGGPRVRIRTDLRRVCPGCLNPPAPGRRPRTPCRRVGRGRRLGVVRVRADRGERLVLRALRSFSQCSWSVRKPKSTWRDAPSTSANSRSRRCARR